MAENPFVNCKDINPAKPDFRNPKAILKAVLGLFQIPLNIQTPFPSPLILASKATRPGLSPSKIASRIIQRQSEAGAPIGPLPSGQESISELMERIRAEEYVNAIVTEMAVDVAVQPGTALTATVPPLVGGQVLGQTIGVATGSGLAR